MRQRDSFFAARGRGISRHPLTQACAAALFGILCAGSHAQDAPSVKNAPAQATAAKPADAKPSAKTPAKPAPRPQDSASTLDTVVVTGIQGSIQNSLKVKENSDDIIEAITAEDIGKLPDPSIAESLARLPGLATQRVDGKADQISIRGLSPDFAGTTLNGREQATIGENRGVEYDQYPSELISGVEVYKTPDASLIGQGLSGTVDLHTIKPLDVAQRTFVANVRGEYNSDGKLNPGTGVGDTGHRTSLSYIDQFFDHTLGIAVGFAQLDSPVQQKHYQAWYWSVDNGPAGIEQTYNYPHTPGLPDNVLSQEGMALRAKSES
jgi:iron complex outermembrane receptor protein